MTLESRLDMPTEETTLLREEEASVKKSAAIKRKAGVMMCAFAALALVSSTTSQRAIPMTMDELIAGLPVWSFLAVLLLGTVGSLLFDKGQGPGLLIYCYSLPYAIMNKACDGNAGGWGAHIAQLAVLVGVGATVLDFLPKTEEGGLIADVRKWINCAAAGMLTVGTAKVVFDRIHQPGVGLVDMFEGALPFLGWMTTSVLAVYTVAFKQPGQRNAYSSMWMLILYTAAELAGASTSGDSLNAKVLKWSCIVGAVWAVVNAFSLLGNYLEDLAGAAILAGMFLPLALDTIQNAEFTVDAIMKNIVSFTFAAILGAHAVTTLLFAITTSEKFTDIGTGNFIAVFALCFVVKHKELIAASGEATKFAKYADMLGQYGPALALVLLILSLLKPILGAGFGQTILIFTNVAQLMMILGILLGS